MLSDIEEIINQHSSETYDLIKDLNVQVVDDKNIS